MRPDGIRQQRWRISATALIAGLCVLAWTPAHAQVSVQASAGGEAFQIEEAAFTGAGLNVDGRFARGPISARVQAGFNRWVQDGRSISTPMVEAGISGRFRTVEAFVSGRLAGVSPQNETELLLTSVSLDPAFASRWPVLPWSEVSSGLRWAWPASERLALSLGGVGRLPFAFDALPDERYQPAAAFSLDAGLTAQHTERAFTNVDVSVTLFGTANLNDEPFASPAPRLTIQLEHRRPIAGAPTTATLAASAGGDPEAEGAIEDPALFSGPYVRLRVQRLQPLGRFPVSLYAGARVTGSTNRPFSSLRVLEAGVRPCFGTVCVDVHAEGGSVQAVEAQSQGWLSIRGGVQIQVPIR